MAGRVRFETRVRIRRLFGLAALMGLFAMHGLASHGTAHEAHPVQPTVTLAAEHAVVAGHRHTDAMTDPAARTAPASVGAGDRSPGPGSLGLAELCLAVLLIGVVLAGVAGRGTVGHRERDRTSRSVRRPAAARRHRDPPCLFALSIQRC